MVVMTCAPLCYATVARSSPLYALMKATNQNAIQTLQRGHLWSDTTITGVNAVFCVLMGFELSRNCGGLGICLLLGVLMIRNCILLLQKYSRQNVTKCLSLYTKVLLIKVAIQKGQALITFVGLGVVLIICVSCNYGTLMMYDVIPMPFYFFFPVVTSMFQILVSIILPKAIGCYTESKDLLLLWRNVLLRRSYYFKRIRSMRIIAFYAGVTDFTFFVFDRTIKATLVWCLVDFTITAMLSFSPT